MTDTEAWDTYPELRHWYDKLWVANQLGYSAGTGPVPCAGHYIVRPVINLQGGGLGASIKFCLVGESVPNDCFWSDVFLGDHITIDYIRVGSAWQQSHTFQGFNTHKDLIQFSRWVRVDHPFVLPAIFDEITCDHINIEIIDNRVIEVHLRKNPDPIEHDEFIPIWTEDQSCPSGFVRIAGVDDDTGRLGFFVKI